MSSVELTKYEKARVIGARALQLSSGAPPLLEVEEFETPMHIAKRELEKAVIPLVVLR
ncbi:MAG: DNA-directed RNA polymerase subunit K [Candidatus Micrarchaeota archaeon]